MVPCFLYTLNEEICLEKYCPTCESFADCRKARGLSYRKWESANVIINTYPDGSMEVIRYKKPFEHLVEAGNLPSADRVRKLIKEGEYWTPVDGFDISSIQQSLRNSSKRSQDTMYGYVLSNEWDYWVTLTLSPEVVNRFDDKSVKAFWSRFEERCKKRNPDCKILAIPEKHKNLALHFHALMADIKLTLIPAINPHTGKEIRTKFGDLVFNIKDWDFGFSTCVVMPRENNLLKVANYLVKYITKSGNIDYNAKRFYHTRNLEFKNKIIAYLSDEEFAASTFKPGTKKKKETERMEVYYCPPTKDNLV